MAYLFLAYADGHAEFVPGGKILGSLADKREWPIANLAS